MFLQRAAECRDLFEAMALMDELQLGGIDGADDPGICQRDEKHHDNSLGAVLQGLFGDWTTSKAGGRGS